MNKWFQKLQDQVDELSLRERALIFLSGTAVIVMTWNFLFFVPQNNVRDSLNLQMGAIQKKLIVRTQEATALAQMVSSSADLKKAQLLIDLRLESANLGSEMSEASAGLIPANELLDVLREVLAQSNELEIDRIEILPPEKLALDLNSLIMTGKAVASGNQGVLKHTVELSLQGSYFDLLRYLQGLEALPWRLYWDSLNYQVSGYPMGDIELRVSTLSMSEALFENKPH